MRIRAINNLLRKSNALSSPGTVFQGLLPDSSWCRVLQSRSQNISNVNEKKTSFRPFSDKHRNLDHRDSMLLDETTTDEPIDTEFSKFINEERMFLIQPDFKWGRARFGSKGKATTYRLDEADALVKSISNWKVNEKTIESLHELHPKYFFGTGKLEVLQTKVDELKRTHNTTAIFVNIGKLTQKQAANLEDLFGCRVYDRYRLVLEIFKERARTKEAKLQVKLAELKYKKMHLTSKDSNFDQQAGGVKSIAGGGETHLEIQRRLLAEKEAKIKKELKQVEVQRKQNRSERINKHVPHVALIGYTNAGKTTLARALSGDCKLEPEDKLFATLDTTVHRGKLPCGMGVLFIDTVGFITDLPHDLIQSFSATLEDVKNATLLVHVRDLTNPEHELQKKSVLQVLDELKVDKTLLDNMLEVHNKCDSGSFASEDEESSGRAFPISALHGNGIEDFKQTVEKSVFDVTGRNMYQLKVDAAGPGFSWLHHNTTILSTEATEDGHFVVQCIMDSTMHSKWKASFEKRQRPRRF